MSTSVRDFWDEVEAQHRYNSARHERRRRGFPDPDHDFTGASGRAYRDQCQVGIHWPTDGQVCLICGAWVIGRPPEDPATDVSGASRRDRRRNVR